MHILTIAEVDFIYLLCKFIHSFVLYRPAIQFQTTISMLHIRSLEEVLSLGYCFQKPRKYCENYSCALIWKKYCPSLEVDIPYTCHVITLQTKQKDEILLPFICI